MCAPATLCSPDSDKACFACCPPIRPAHYEHIHYRKTMERFLRENRSRFSGRTKGHLKEAGFKKDIVPITGYSCWALGFIDADYKKVGCLLHPAQNGGNDLRYRIDYGDKCRRETCQEEKVFASLEIPARVFWLQLANGLDSFTYSSRTMNPLFKMMGWGKPLLQRIVTEEEDKAFTWETFLQAYPFFKTTLRPKAHAYLVNALVRERGLSIIKTEAFSFQLEIFIPRFLKRLQQEMETGNNQPFVHQLNLDSAFLDFLRLAGHVTRQGKESVLHLKRIVDDELGRF
jgi:hypothetical protein